jgi:hypothetical protein
MSRALRTNDDAERKTSTTQVSAFARVALGKVGGSSVYIEPKKTKTKLLDTDSVT